MKKFSVRAAVAMAVFCLALSATAQEQRNISTDPNFTWRGQLGAGKTITVVGVNGRVRATAASGNAAEIRTEKTTQSNGNLNEVWVEVVEHANGVTICAIHSKDRPEPGRCRQDGSTSGWSMGNAGRNVRLDFEVRVPKGVRFVGRTTNGGIEALDMASVVEAETTNGAIRISTSEWASAETTNGSLDVEMGKASWSNSLNLETTNGSVKVALPADAGFELNAETTNGSVTSDFEITMQGRMRRNRMNGTVGQGGRALNVETTNGSVRIRKAATSL